MRGRLRGRGGCGSLREALIVRGIAAIDHPSLRLHGLSGRMQGVHLVSINLSYRITLELLIQDEKIIPLNVGNHDAVY